MLNKKKKVVPDWANSICVHCGRTQLKDHDEDEHYIELWAIVLILIGMGFVIGIFFIIILNYFFGFICLASL